MPNTCNAHDEDTGPSSDLTITSRAASSFALGSVLPSTAKLNLPHRKDAVARFFHHCAIEGLDAAEVIIDCSGVGARAFANFLGGCAFEAFVGENVSRGFEQMLRVPWRSSSVFARGAERARLIVDRAIGLC